MELKGKLISDIKIEKVTNMEMASFHILHEGKDIYCVLSQNLFGKLNHIQKEDVIYLKGVLKEIKFTKNNIVNQNSIFTVESLNTSVEYQLNEQLRQSVVNFDIKGIKTAISKGADILCLGKEQLSKLSHVQKIEIKNIFREVAKSQNLTRVNEIEAKLKH